MRHPQPETVWLLPPCTILHSPTRSVKIFLFVSSEEALLRLALRCGGEWAPGGGRGRTGAEAKAPGPVGCPPPTGTGGTPRTRKPRRGAAPDTPGRWVGESNKGGSV